jgi:hypothetical protein
MTTHPIDGDTYADPRLHFPSPPLARERDGLREEGQAIATRSDQIQKTPDERIFVISITSAPFGHSTFRVLIYRHFFTLSAV